MLLLLAWTRHRSLWQPLLIPRLLRLPGGLLLLLPPAACVLDLAIALFVGTVRTPCLLHQLTLSLLLLPRLLLLAGRLLLLLLRSVTANARLHTTCTAGFAVPRALLI